MKPLRLELRLRNNRIAAGREALGLTQTLAAQAAGIQKTEWCSYETLRFKPYGKRGWRKGALKIAGFLGELPEDLWPGIIQRVQQRLLTKIVDEAEVAALAGMSQPAALPGVSGDDRVVLGRVLDTVLPGRSGQIVRQRFFEEPQPTIHELALRWRISTQRMQDILQHALTVLRRSPTIREYDDDAYNYDQEEKQYQAESRAAVKRALTARLTRRYPDGIGLTRQANGD